MSGKRLEHPRTERGEGLIYLRVAGVEAQSLKQCLGELQNGIGQNDRYQFESITKEYGYYNTWEIRGENMIKINELLVLVFAIGVSVREIPTAYSR